MAKNHLYILGSGSFAKEIRSYLTQDDSQHLIHFVDDFGGEITIEEYRASCHGQSVMGSGHPDIRAKMLSQIKKPYISYAHRTSWVSDDSSMRGDAGIVLGPMVVVAPGAMLHDHVLVNYGAVVSHDVVIHSLTVVAPRAVILGNCVIGMGTYVGANSTIKEKVRVGDGCMIGMGAVVLKDVPDYHVAVGNPAIIVPKKDWPEVSKRLSRASQVLQ